MEDIAKFSFCSSFHNCATLFILPFPSQREGLQGLFQEDVEEVKHQVTLSTWSLSTYGRNTQMLSQSAKGE